MGKVGRYFEAEAVPSKPAPPRVETIIAKTRKHKKFGGVGRRRARKGPVTPDPFPDKPQVPKETLRKYSRGSGLKGSPQIKTNIHKEKIRRKDEKIKIGLESAARTEILLQEEHGYLTTTQIY